MQKAEKQYIPSLFDELDKQKFQTYKIWQKHQFPQEGSLLKQGILFKKSKKKNSWKSYLFKLFDHVLVKYSSSDKKQYKGFTDIENLRIERIKYQSSTKEVRYGFRLESHNKYLELYDQTKEDMQAWVKFLIKFCIQKNFDADYKLIKLLGKGNFAQVYYARSLLSGIEYAIKAFEKDKFADIHVDRPALIKELAILRKMDHSGVIQLYEVYESQNQLYLVMELLRGGELFKKLQGQSTFNEEYASKIMLNLLSAIQYIHTKNVLHRDLKPENLILRSKEEETDLCIADFGLSDFYDPQGNYMFKRCGTPGYVAPEVLADKIYDYKVDPFSAGVIMFIILTGSSPFKGKNYDDIVMKNYNCTIDFKTKDMHKKLSAECFDLLQKLLCKDVKKRYSVDEALNHPWFKNLKQGDKDYEDEEFEGLPSPVRPTNNDMYCKSPLMKHVKDLPEGCESPNTWKKGNGKKALQQQLLMDQEKDKPNKMSLKLQKVEQGQQLEEAVDELDLNDYGSPMLRSPDVKKRKTQDDDFKKGSLIKPQNADSDNFKLDKN